MRNISQKAQRVDQAAKRERLDSPGVVQKTKATRHPIDGRWFKLTSVSSSPMTGHRQTCSDGSFSESDQTDISIYPHPQLTISNYAVNDYVFASYIGNCWVAVCGAGGGVIYTAGDGISISGSNVISSTLVTC